MNEDRDSISVVIPTLNGGATIERLLSGIERQSVEPKEIIVIDSSSDDQTVEIAHSHPSVQTIAVNRKDFDHGATRHAAFVQASGAIVCFLTQDSQPVDDSYLEQLTKVFREPSVGMSSGRQVARPEARRYEQLVREFNYPDKSEIHTLKDLPRLGIKTFFASDVCSAYRRTAYMRCGGFPACETNEDMLMAALMIQHGFGVAYSAEAKVVHSHDLSFPEQFARNRKVGRFLVEYESELMEAQELGEGRRMVRQIVGQLLDERDPRELVAFGADCAARLLGSRIGRLEARRGEGRRR